MGLLLYAYALICFVIVVAYFLSRAAAFPESRLRAAVSAFGFVGWPAFISLAVNVLPEQAINVLYAVGVTGGTVCVAVVLYREMQRR